MKLIRIQIATYIYSKMAALSIFFCDMKSRPEKVYIVSYLMSVFELLRSFENLFFSRSDNSCGKVL